MHQMLNETNKQRREACRLEIIKFIREQEYDIQDKPLTNGMEINT